MNIRDKRLKAETDRIIKENLSKGYIPSSDEVISELSRYISNNDLSAPSFKFSKKQRNFAAKDIDKAKQLTLGDLKIIYECLAELHMLVDGQMEKFSTEKKKYDYRLSELESRLAEAVGRYSAGGYADGYSESFKDLKSVDLERTTADIDIVNGEASLRRLNDTPFNTFNVSVSVQGNSSIVRNGDVNDYISTKGNVWQGIVEKENQEETVFIMTVDTGDINDINRLETETPLLKKCDVTVESSTDGYNWTKEYEGRVINRCSTNFSSKLRYIKMSFKRTEADKFVSGKYLYYFLVDTVKLGSVSYAVESEVVSLPIKSSGNINKVSIVSQSEIPPSSSIQYYVSPVSENPVWTPLTPANSKGTEGMKSVSFNTVEAGRRAFISIPIGISADTYELKDLSVNGQRLFGIYELTDLEITGHKLYKGVSSWKVESIPIHMEGAQTQSLFVQYAKNISVSYKAMIEDKPGLILNEETFAANSVKKYSVAIYRDNGDIAVKDTVASSRPITVYLNGSILYKGLPTSGTTITYPFKKGLNLLEIIVNIGGAPVTASLDINANIRSYGSFICANRDPMRQVSLFDLRYNTNNQRDVYSLREVAGKYIVVVKDADLAIGYDLIYDCVVNPMSEILVKAVLRREYPTVNVTPRLKNYEVRFF